MKAVILGAGGQLANDLVPRMEAWQLVLLRREELDICHHEKVRQMLQAISPQHVINTAAFVDVDGCEEQIDKAFQVNAAAVNNLAQICSELDCTLTQISTDYVFDGTKESPYKEDDLPNPLNVYGTSKLAGEYFARNYVEKHFVVRTSGLYGTAGSGKSEGNFVETMIRLAAEEQTLRVVDDQVLAPTYTVHLAQAVYQLISTSQYGIYHITNQGQCTWFDFARMILDQAGVDVQLEPVSSQQIKRRARRPSFSVLDNGKLRSVIGTELPHWEEGLTSYFQERKGTLPGVFHEQEG